MYVDPFTCHKSVHAGPMTPRIHRLPVARLTPNYGSFTVRFPLLALVVMAVDGFVHVVGFRTVLAFFAVAVVLKWTYYNKLLRLEPPLIAFLAVT